MRPIVHKCNAFLVPHCSILTLLSKPRRLRIESGHTMR